MTLPPAGPPSPQAQPTSCGLPAWPGPHAAPSTQVSGFAIASLVLSLACLAPLGLIFGIIALVRISQHRERGRGLAVAGIAVSSVVLLFSLLVMVGALHFSVWSSNTPRGPASQSSAASVFALKTGDCFTPATELSPDNQGPLRNATAERLPCDGPHRGEIYGSFELSGQGAFPGTEEVMKTSRERCGALLPDYALDFMAHGRLQTYFYYPDRGGWERGRRTVLCWAGKPQGNLRESIRMGESDVDPAQYRYLRAFRPLLEAQLRSPQQGPDRDLAAASGWAGQMGAAYAETARLLGEARGGLPGDARGPAGRIVVRFEEAVPYWEQASRAENAEAFLAALKEAESDSDVIAELDSEARTAMGLPTAETTAPSGGEEA
ncbi:DUF4190 domain-containing protein [Streptomyces sp. NBC_01693]|uniref:DUF4190 domain-containing protein n=1 Tax=Streptomyces sp. NBC_01693 TaxID=2975912 RepID=UPI002E2F485F|nr:DUF4190 domain-containing protein [Streptomyces sp. NBC_01693]